MEHQTWNIPADQQRSKAAQNLDDLKFTLILWWEYLIGPFKPAPTPMTTAMDPNKPPVLIIPGFICRPAIYKRMQRAIHAAGYACHILPLGYQVSNLLGKGRKVSAYLDKHGIDESYVVAHSMGGLILTSALVQGEQRIKHAWTLGAPIWGTNVVWALFGLVAIVLACNQSAGWNWAMLLLVCFLSPGLRQMMPGSDFLEFTSKEYDSMQNVTSVFCAMDAIVFQALWKEPGSSSRFRRPDDVLFPEVGHNNIAMGQNAIDCIVRAIDVKESSESER